MVTCPKSPRKKSVKFGGKLLLLCCVHKMTYFGILLFSHEIFLSFARLSLSVQILHDWGCSSGSSLLVRYYRTVQTSKTVVIHFFIFIQIVEVEDIVLSWLHLWKVRYLINGVLLFKGFKDQGTNRLCSRFMVVLIYFGRRRGLKFLLMVLTLWLVLLFVGGRWFDGNLLFIDFWLTEMTGFRWRFFFWFEGGGGLKAVAVQSPALKGGGKMTASHISIHYLF